MRELNKKFKNKNKTTDVLSFPFHNKINSKKNIYLGDIAISYEIINKRFNFKSCKSSRRKSKRNSK